MALLIAVSVAKPVSNSAAEDSDDLQTAQQFGFGYGGGYSPYGNYSEYLEPKIPNCSGRLISNVIFLFLFTKLFTDNGGYYRRRGSSSSSESHEHGRYYRF